MSKGFFVLAVVLVIIFIPFVYASHYIVGIVEDAQDGTLANGHTVMLWDYYGGQSDNLTDVVGPTGNSGNDDFYLIDCELLSGSCGVGDVMSVQVVNDGDDYVSEVVNVSVTGAGFDVAFNLSLNSPSNATLVFPESFANLSSVEVEFNCSVSDLDSNLANVTLYGNWSSGWHANETQSVSGSSDYAIFNKNISQGVYEYSCYVTDNLSISSFAAANRTFVVDTTLPQISSVELNASNSCGVLDSVRVNCTATDQILNVDTVLVEAKNSNWQRNYSTQVLTGDTSYVDILANETGIWNFNCFVNDSAGNRNNFTSLDLEVYSSSPEFFVNSSKISFSNSNPIETESVLVISEVENLACVDSTNVLVGLFDGDPDLSGQLIENQSVSISNLSFQQINFTWNAEIGLTNLFVFADSNFSFSEDDESNNKGNGSVSVNAWQQVYGNASVDKLIGVGGNNLSLWINESVLQGGIFVSDTEANVDWLSLQSIGKTTLGTNSSNDFLEIDNLLGMENFTDSVSIVFSNSQVPKETQNFLIHQNNILEVPVVNSTNSSNFITGILWDFSDDTNNEYDQLEKEDLVFVTKLNKQAQGSYGIYDYELRVPAKIREYDPTDSTEFYLYYDLN